MRRKLPLRSVLALCGVLAIASLQLSSCFLLTGDDTVWAKLNVPFKGGTITLNIPIPDSCARLYPQMPGHREFNYYLNDAPGYPGIGNIVAAVQPFVSLGATTLEDSAQLLLNVAQSLRYVPEPVTTSNSQHPVTTLLYGGDCEDLSIFYAALLREFRIPAVFILTPAHCFVGVHCPTKPMYCYFNGKPYTLAETTGPWTLGAVPQMLERTEWQSIVPVKDFGISAPTAPTNRASPKRPDIYTPADLPDHIRAALRAAYSRLQGCFTQSPPASASDAQTVAAPFANGPASGGALKSTR